MEIVIEGWREGSEERREAASAPEGQLPKLTWEFVLAIELANGEIRAEGLVH
jgi:hypothetical protein